MNTLIKKKKKYVSPIIRKQNIELESTIAAGSTSTMYLESPNDSTVEFWDTEYLSTPIQNEIIL